jgi:hypothetical protein
MANCSRSSAIVLSLLLATPALAVNRYFPSPPGDTGDDTIDYDLGSFNLVVVGFSPEPTAPDSYPYPDTEPTGTTLTVADGGIIHSNTYVYNNSTLTVTGGTLQEVYLSYDPVTEGPLAGESATVNVSGGTLGSVNGYYQDTINVSGGEMMTVSGDLSSTIHISGGLIIDEVVATSSSTATISGGHILGEVHAGNNGGLADPSGTIVIDDATLDGTLAAQGSGKLTLNGGSATAGAAASEQGYLTLAGGTLGGDVTATGDSTVDLGNTKISGGISVADRALLVNTTGSGTIGGGITARGNAQINLIAKQITGSLDLSGTSITTLHNCSITASIDSAVDTSSSAQLKLTGGSTVTGDVHAVGTSTITLQGSLVTGDVYADSTATVNLQEGIIVGHVFVLGGTFNYSGGIVTQNVSVMNLFSANSLRGSGAAADSLGFTVEDGGLLNIYGTDFAVQLIDAHYLGQFSEYALTGTLADGTLLNGDTLLLQNGSNSAFELLPPVPEPPIGALVATAAIAVFRDGRRRHCATKQR